MRTRALPAVILLALGAVIGIVHASWAQDEPFPIELNVDESFDVCSSGQILCPARSAFCDDTKVAVPIELPGGLGFKGIGPGTTLCSAASSLGSRRVFRVTVRSK